jgi:TonB-linked SusC/RagA family outer membrane protein
MSIKNKIFMKSRIFSILFFFGCMLVTAQTGSLTGSVSDANSNESLPGVNVVVKNTTNGTNTDFNGNFSLSDVSSGDVIVFSYIGYKTFEYTVSSSFNISISLEEDVEALEEVVLLGYVSQKASNISGAVTTVDGEAVAKLKPVRVEDALQGQSGINVIASGAPGSKPTVLIRGISSYSGNDPLVIVDGINLTLDDMASLDPSNIESISILKDASTTALYGVEGGNGVVLITTKSGKRNQETQFSFDSSYGQQSVEKTIAVLNATEYAAILNEGSVASGGPAIFTNIDLGVGTDWQKEVLRTDAPIVVNNFSARGGSETVSYFLGTGYTTQEGVLYGEDKSFFNRLNFTANIDADLSSKLTARVYNTYSNEKSSGLGDVLFNALNMSPTTPIFDADGNYGISTTITQEVKNPLAQISNTYNEGNTNKITGKLELEYDVFSDFSITTRLGYNYVDVKGKSFNPLVYYGAGHNQTNSLADGSPIVTVDSETGETSSTHNRVNESSVEYFRYNFEVLGNYSFTVNDEHNFNVFAGFSMTKNTGEGLYGSAVDVPFNSWDFADISAATGTEELQTTQSWNSVGRKISAMARVEYDFNEKYLASLTLRRDGSTSFGQNNKFGYFPSASLGWVLSNEDYFNSSSINFLKLRASYGIVGNDNITPQFATISTFPKYTFGNTITAGSTLYAIPNLDVSWENQVQTNVGLDLRMFDSSLSLTVDYFEKSTEDLLFNPTLSLYLGTPVYPTANIGSTETTGFDISLGYSDDFGDNISFGTSISFTTADNMVTEIANGDKYIWGAGYGIPYKNLTQFREGESPGIFWGYKTDGIFQNYSEISAHATQPNAQPGDIRFVDVDGNGLIDSNDRTKIGDPFADYTIGWNLNLNVYNFDLNVFTYGSFGNDVYRAYERNLSYTNKFARVLDRWTGEGTSNTEPRYSFVDGNNNTRASDRYVEDGSFVKIKNVQLGYNFNLSESSNFDSVRLYLQGKNLFTFTDYSGYDPEMSGGVLGSGIDYGNYPTPRIVSVGLNVKF